MASRATRRILGIIRWPTTFPGKIQKAENIISAVTVAVKTFVTPTPTMAVLSAAVLELTTLETAANTRARGSADARDTQWLAVSSLYAQLLAYVQVIADNAGGPTQAAAVFALADMDTEAGHGRGPRVYKSAQEKSGTVEVEAPTTPDNTATLWQYGASPSALTSYVVTIHSTVSIPNQTPGTTLYIRYLVVTVDGYGDWSQTLAHLVT
jgi:hypothetical protein